MDCSYFHLQLFPLKSFEFTLNDRISCSVARETICIHYAHNKVGYGQVRGASPLAVQWPFGQLGFHPGLVQFYILIVVHWLGSCCLPIHTHTHIHTHTYIHTHTHMWRLM